MRVAVVGKVEAMYQQASKVNDHSNVDKYTN